jgi:UDP-2-acetamido-2-deoxy-ribo-hexuluronate aminotransferase
MPSIEMVDLQTQYLHLKNQIDKEIEKVLLSGTYIKGPEVQLFESQLAAYTGSSQVISCANGTDALMIAFMALNLPAGSEVITPAFSYAAVAETLHLLKLIPVYAEVNEQTFLLDPATLESLITAKTAAIVPVHLYGQCSDMEPILVFAKKHNLYVIEDNAQAIGAIYTFSNGQKAQAGTMGHVNTTSFFPTKNLGCYGDGGALFVQDNELAQRARMIANHGQQVKYSHELIGVNSRLDAVQAAILNVKLNHLNEFIESRQLAASTYDAGLSGIAELKIPYRSNASTHVFHQYTITLQDQQMRDNLKTHLVSKAIPSMIYYHLPLYKQVAYKQDVNLPISEDLCNRVLSLPMHTELSEAQLEFIVTQIKEFFNT